MRAQGITQQREDFLRRMVKVTMISEDGRLRRFQLPAAMAYSKNDLRKAIRQLEEVYEVEFLNAIEVTERAIDVGR